jgi:dimethylargininase
VVFSAAYPRTAERLDSASIQNRLVVSSELAKAEGALTCCSLIFDV